MPDLHDSIWSLRCLTCIIVSSPRCARARGREGGEGYTSLQMQGTGRSLCHEMPTGYSSASSAASTSTHNGSWQDIRSSTFHEAMPFQIFSRSPLSFFPRMYIWTANFECIGQVNVEDYALYILSRADCKSNPIQSIFGGRLLDHVEGWHRILPSLQNQQSVSFSKGLMEEDLFLH